VTSGNISSRNSDKNTAINSVEAEISDDKMARLLKNKYFWVAIALVSFLGIFYHAADIFVIGWLAPHTYLGLTHRTFQRSLFLIPILITAWKFGFKGGLICSIVSGLIMTPRVIVSPWRMDAATETVAIVAIGTALSWLISAQQKTKIQQQSLATRLATTHKKLKIETTERKQIQERLFTSERLATLGQFAGSISHELRNPLSVIDSSAYYLRAKLKDADKKTLEHLNRIQSSVGSATAIIESLFNLTRMKEPQLSGLDLIATTHDAIVTSKVSDTVNVIRNFPEQEVLVNADREQLGMAFQNIVKNAGEAMDGKGTLTVTVHTSADGQAEVSFADTGPGIAPEDMDRVFQPLFSTKAKGIGFGLSIAKTIVNKHGGTVEAKSELGKGAVIIIRLPPYTDKDKEV